MKIYTKDVESLGFKCSGMFDDSKWNQFYYTKIQNKHRVYIIDNVDNSISHFNLNKKEWEAFEDGQLSLIPIGCCCATGNKFKENPVVDFQGDFEKFFGTKKKMLKYIEKLVK